MYKYYVNKKEFDGKVFYYKDFGSEIHGGISFRLWISAKLIKADENGREYITLPCRAQITKTEKGTLILKPGDKYVFDVFIRCGYRGRSYIDIIEPTEYQYIEYDIFESPRGNLGISAGALIEVDIDKIKVRWEKTGRLYGAASTGISIYYADGHIENISDIQLDELDVIDDDM